jgi:Zn-dependent protease
MPDKPSQELVLALAGPLVDLIVAAGLLLGLTLTGTWQPLASLTTTSGNLLERLLAVNVFLVVFNLLPAFPMDGGRILRSLLAMQLDYARATGIAARIGQGMAMVFGFMIRRAQANCPPPPRVPPVMAVPPVIGDLYPSRNRAT